MGGRTTKCQPKKGAEKMSDYGIGVRFGNVPGIFRRPFRGTRLQKGMGW